MMTRTTEGTLFQQGENVWLRRDTGETRTWRAATPEAAKQNFLAMTGETSARFEAWIG